MWSFCAAKLSEDCSANSENCSENSENPQKHEQSLAVLQAARILKFFFSKQTSLKPNSQVPEFVSNVCKIYLLLLSKFPRF